MSSHLARLCQGECTWRILVALKKLRPSNKYGYVRANVPGEKPLGGGGGRKKNIFQKCLKLIWAHLG